MQLLTETNQVVLLYAVTLKMKFTHNDFSSTFIHIVFTFDRARMKLVYFSSSLIIGHLRLFVYFSL